MREWQISVARRYAVAIIVLCLCLSCRAAPPFVLRVVSIPGSTYYGAMVNSTEPDVLGFLAPPPFQLRKSEGSTVAGFRWQPDSASLLGTGTPQLPVQRHVLLLLGATKAITWTRKRTQAEPPETTCSFHFLADGKETEIATPGLNQAIRSVSSFWPFFADYAPDAGLILVDSDPGIVVRAWAGTELHREPSRVEGVIALGSGFLDGRLTIAAVTREGKALSFDPSRRKFVEQPRLAWLGELTQKSVPSPPRNTPCFLAFARDVAALRTDAEILIMSASGTVTRLPRNPKLSWRGPDGFERSGEAIMRIKDDPLALKDEGRRASPLVISNLGFPSPLNDASVVIFDSVYQRIVVVSAPK